MRQYYNKDKDKWYSDNQPLVYRVNQSKIRISCPDADDMWDTEYMEDDEEYEWVWEDQLKDGCGPFDSFGNAAIYSNNDTTLKFSVASSISGTVFKFKVNEGEEWRIRGLKAYGDKYRAWSLHTAISPARTNNSDLSSTFLLGYSDPIRTSARNDVSCDLKIPTGAKMLCLATGNDYTTALKVYKKVKKPRIRKDGGVIKGWMDYSMNTNYDSYLWRHLEVGGNMLYRNNNTFWIVAQSNNAVVQRSIAQRMVILKVNEGDTLLLNVVGWTDSNGIVFTDNDRKIQSIPEVGQGFVRRGIYTAPCDGYAYIQDVLYSDENYFFSKEFAYMAEQMKDKMDYERQYKKVVLNEFNTSLLDPFVVNITATAATYAKSFTSAGGGSAFYMPVAKYKLPNTYFTAVALHIVVGSNHTAGGTITKIVNNYGTSIMLQYQKTFTTLNDLAGDPDGCWVFQIVVPDVSDHCQDSYLHRCMCWDRFVQLNLGSLTIDGTIDFTVDDVFLTRSTDYCELTDLIWFGSNKFTDVHPVKGVLVVPDTPKSTDARLLSTSKVGYDVFERGNNIPINATALEYAASMKASTPSISGGGYRKYRQNTSIHYYPTIDVSGITNFQEFFSGCYNMKTVPDFTFTTSSINYSSMFTGCARLREVGELTNMKPSAITSMFNGCFNLERVKGTINFSFNAGSTALWGSYPVQVKRVECCDFTNYTGTGGEQVAYSVLASVILSSLRYLLIKGLGTSPNHVNLYAHKLTWWGINSYEITDARQSVIDSLYTYSYDRAGANETARQAFIADALGTVIGIYASDALPETADDGDLALVTGSADVMVWNQATIEWVVLRTAETGDKYATATSAYTWSGSAWTQWAKPYPNMNVRLRKYIYDNLTAEEKAMITAKGYTLTKTYIDGSG